MAACDVLIVGGGPAGSTCAWKLVQAGVDVVVVDKARFPRDKVCAGWITPAVVRALELDLGEYASRHTLQPFTGFRTGPLDRGLRTTDFGVPISYGIRRCEFDDYLLRRSGARVETAPGVALRDLENGARSRFATVGAGGHICPVARQLNPREDPEDVVVAQEIEFRLDDEMAQACRVRGECPELFFWPDLMGYGWCVRKGQHLNVGAGRLSRTNFPAAVREFAAMLAARGLTPMPRGAWKGHAYLLDCTSGRRLVGERTLLIGDAAGLALAPSGEGILAAVESGLIAADVILQTAPDCTGDRLAVYEERIEARFGPRQARRRLAGVPTWMRTAAARALFNSSWLTRRFLLEDGFLHVRRTDLRGLFSGSARTCGGASS
jgi:flavin-dependent dehydrogenase